MHGTAAAGLILSPGSGEVTDGRGRTHDPPSPHAGQG